MNFKVCYGEIATNYSVNITCFGSFNAKSVSEAIDRINLNIKHKWCLKWQFPDPEQWIECMYDKYLRKRLFVCSDNENVIWKDSNAIIKFFDS